MKLNFFYSFLHFFLFISALVSCKQETIPVPPGAAFTPSQKKLDTQIVLKQVPAQNLRGVWLAKTPQGYFESKANLEKVLSQLAEWNFNAIFPAVYTGGHTLYPSEFFKSETGLIQDFNPLFRNRDVVAEIIEIGESKKVSIIPWFEYGLMVPVRSDLGKKKQNWLAKDASGNFSRIENGVEMGWMNILKPEVQDYFYKLFSEFVAKYKTGTIQVDDHFGIPREFLSDAETKQLFFKLTGKTGALNSEKDALWEDFHSWKMGQVTGAVKLLFSKLKTQFPGLKISLSPNPLAFSQQKYHQDWKQWLDDGTIDNISLQIYRDDNAAFQKELEAVFQVVPKEKLFVGILAGVSSKILPVKTLQFQTNLSLQKQAAGVVYFSYDTFFDLPATSFNPKETASERRSFWDTIF